MSLDIGSVSYDDPVAGYTASAGKYWEVWLPGGADFDEDTVRGTAGDGQIRRIGGFISEELYAQVLYVGASVGDVISNFEEDKSTLETTTFEVDCPDSREYAACRLMKKKGFRRMGYPKDTGHGTYMMPVLIRMEQIRRS